MVFRAASAAAPLCRMVASLSSAYLALAFGIDLIRRLPRAQLLDHTLVRLRTAVVKGAEPAVGGKQRVAVIALEVAVVQIVEEIAGKLDAAFHLDFVEAYMPDALHQRRDLQGEHGVDRVRGHNPVQQHDLEKDDMFDRVHRQTGPWAGIDVLEMDIMGLL